MNNDKKFKITLCFGGLISILLGIFLSNDFTSNEKLPERETLNSATGYVSWSSYGKYSIMFKLPNYPLIFNYSKKGRGSEVIYNAISGSEEIHVLYKEYRTDKLFGSNENSYGVYEIELPGKKVRTYREIREAWESDNKLGFWLGIFFIISGIFQLSSAFRHKVNT